MTNSMNNEKIKNVYTFISLMNQIAYKDIFMLSCQVLSKNPFTNSFLMRYLKNKKVQKWRLISIFRKLLKYYFFSFKNYIKYLIGFIEYFLSGIKFNHNSSNNQLILIDMPFLISNIQKSCSFTDSYFPGLTNLLSKMHLQYAYLPEFVGMKKDFTLFKILKILKREKIPIITEYQLLTSLDLFRILHFIIFYPLRVYRFLKRLNEDVYEQNLLKSELMDTLDQITFSSFSRYLQGRRIAQLRYKNIKVISWDENQVTNKNLYKGLRQNCKKVKIYGAQLLIYSKNVLNIVTDENETDFGIVPDKIVVNGPWYLPKKTCLNYTLGPSLRFSKIFSTNIEKSNMRNILVLLPYYKDEARNILELLNKITTFPAPLLIKPHPAIDIKEFQHLFPLNAILAKENIYGLFKKTKIMISGGASGTLVEATSLGIPTIFIKDPQKFNGNPLPDYGKGVIWDEAINSKELKEKIYKFDKALIHNYSEINNFSRFYKENFFCEPTEENIRKAFDLCPISDN